MQRFVFAVAAIAATFMAAPAEASQLVYTTTLSGHVDPTNTGSNAAGAATIRVDTDTQTVDAQITITGLTFEDLSHHLAHSAMGPIHLHRYAANGDVTLIVPFPFGASYVTTPNGFTVTVTNYKYTDGAALLHSNLSFADFLTALSSDPIYLNVHTQRFGDGEISGRLAPAA